MMIRRRFLHLAVGAAALPAVSRIACAQAYPTRPVRIVIGFPAGAGGDIVARLIGQSLSERVGQPVIIENRPGAGASLGAESVVRAAPDGYTLLLCSSSDAVNATMYDNLKFNFVRDIAPVGSIAVGPLVLAVHPSFPAKSVAEFIAYAKTNPGKVSFGSAGIGTVAHMAGELFKFMSGVNFLHVPYRGAAAALTDLLGGQVQVTFSSVPSAIEHIRTGKLRALAVTSATRDEALPDLPTIADFLPGYEATLIYGLCAPRDTSAEIIGRLNRETTAALADAGIKAKLADLGNVPLAMTAADFGKLIADETGKWAKVIRGANVKVQ
jgi:tripartite-type tricarboxylate transporter receptor subunit TctC